MDSEGLLDEVEIFSLTWDTPINSFTWRLGQSIKIGKDGSKRYPISLIARDENHFHKFGNIVYKIYITTENGNKLWKAIVNKPVEITFNV
jgi:hypothetical protein